MPLGVTPNALLFAKITALLQYPQLCEITAVRESNWTLKHGSKRECVPFIFIQKYHKQQVCIDES